MVRPQPCKFIRRLAKARDRLTATRREDYSRDVDYRRVVTLRRNKVRQMEKQIERMKEKYGEPNEPPE